MKYLTILVILTLLSCDSENGAKTISKKEQSNIQLIEKESMFLLLDSETTSNIGQTVLFESDSKHYLVFFNSNNYNFYFYNLTTAELEKKVEFNRDGPNGLGSRIASFKFENNNFLIHSYYTNEIITADLKGNVLNRLKIDIKTNEIHPNSSRKMPLTNINEDIFLFTGQSCNSKNLKEKRAILKISKADQSLLAPFPDSYLLKSDKSYWPSGFCDITFSKGPKNQLFFSYALDKNLYSISNSESEISSHQIKMDNFEVDTSPLSKSTFNKDPRQEQTKIFSRTRFSGLYYDKYKNVFVRRIDFPIENRSDGSMRSSSKLQFIDENFKILGYSEIKGKDHLFFTEEGLHQIIFSTKLEDSLKIKRYEYNF